MRVFIVALFLLSSIITTGSAFPPSGVENVQILDADVHYEFGEGIDFEARVRSDQPITTVYLSIQAVGADILLNTMDLTADGQVRFHYDAGQNTIRPFSRVYYWFRVVTGPDQQEFTSPSYWFDYEDNRFEWQTLENGEFRVNWFEGDAFFGQEIMNVSLDGLESVGELLPLQMPKPISVYVYPSASDLQSALQLSGMPNVAGYAQPDLGVVMVSIPNGPEKTLELERQIPHELAHLLLYQVGDENYDRLPGWLVEGLASLAELFTNPDYARVLESAKANGALLPIASLCGTFPDNPEGNYLAYAEAASFTRYIHQRYGTTSLQALIQAYSNGLGCQEAVESVLGQSLDILETEWQVNQLEMDLEAKGWQNLVPYLVLLGLILAVPLVIWIQFRAKRHVTTGASS